MHLIIAAIIISRIHDIYWSSKKNGQWVRREVSIVKSIVRTIAWLIVIIVALTCDIKFF